MINPNTNKDIPNTPKDIMALFFEEAFLKAGLLLCTDFPIFIALPRGFVIFLSITFVVLSHVLLFLKHMGVEPHRLPCA
jgi:hypothetical protein